MSRGVLRTLHYMGTAHHARIHYIRRSQHMSYIYTHIAYTHMHIYPYYLPLIHTPIL